MKTMDNPAIRGVSLTEGAERKTESEEEEEGTRISTSAARADEGENGVVGLATDCLSHQDELAQTRIGPASLHPRTKSLKDTKA